MAEKEELLKEVVGIITQELTRDAVHKNRKKELVYTCNVAQNMSGWIGLSVTKDRSDGRVGVSPIVGVRSEEIEALVEKHWGRPAPTISISLGYLMPEQRHLEWLFESEPFDYVSEAKKVTKAIETYGIPFMKANASLDVIVDDLEHLRFSFKESVEYRLPVAYLLVNKTDRAVKYVNERLAALDGRQDDAAVRYRAFGAAFLQEAMER
jgi:hypothetical protein